MVAANQTVQDFLAALALTLSDVLRLVRVIDPFSEHRHETPTSARCWTRAAFREERAL